VLTTSTLTLHSACSMGSRNLRQHSANPLQSERALLARSINAKASSSYTQCHPLHTMLAVGSPLTSQICMQISARVHGLRVRRSDLFITLRPIELIQDGWLSVAFSNCWPPPRSHAPLTEVLMSSSFPHPLHHTQAIATRAPCQRGV